MENLPAILDALPETPLAIVALAMLIVGGVAYFLFKAEKLPIYRSFALLVVLLGLAMGVAAVIYSPSLANSSATPTTPSVEAAEPVKDTPEAEPAQQEPVVAAVDCSAFDLSPVTNMAVNGALWCGGPGATRNIYQQAQADPTPSCKAYVTKNYANLSQNQLFNEAVTFAKQGKDDMAMEMMDACQCHNPVSQALIEAKRDEVLCALRFH